MTLYRQYRNSHGELQEAEKVSQKLKFLEISDVQSVQIETCFYVEFSSSEESYSQEKYEKLHRILGDSWTENLGLTEESKFLELDSEIEILVEVGPRLNFSTPWSTNCVSICHATGLTEIKRLEKAVRHRIKFFKTPSDETITNVINSLHDPMTQQIYKEGLKSFALGSETAADWFTVDVLGRGMDALREVNNSMGLGFDEWDFKFYKDLFVDKMQRNPTSVELFDLAQSNSEHSRHWFFKGKYFLDGKLLPESLLSMVISTNDKKFTNDNNVIKFNDNSSGIKGWCLPILQAFLPNKHSPMVIIRRTRDIIFTAETHNFPTGVSPFSGATTGTGGRIRDIQAAGRGGHVIAGTAGYCFGNLYIPGYEMEWEKPDVYPTNFAMPLEIAIQASNGASDYGNKFGEPVICGFSRSFGGIIRKKRCEWIKPIMFSGGIGSIDHTMITKTGPINNYEAPEDHFLCKVGGPVYRIGVGGGAASSVEVQGDNAASRDLGAVQRGDPEMGQKLNRVIRGCAELLHKNPISSIHDQGAGGNANVLKEIVESQDFGAIIFTEEFELGDPTLSTLEIWAAEYQETNALLVHKNEEPSLRELCNRERCPLSVVGRGTYETKFLLVESPFLECADVCNIKKQLPVDLDIEDVLGNIPQKEYHWSTVLESTDLPILSGLKTITVESAIKRVLRLPSVASKRYLTNKVDRSVTGLIAQQQCVGPFHTPVSDVAVVALSHFAKEGSATSIGEQPIKTLINPEAGARMSVIEAITNMASCCITDLKDIKCSGNWMWPAKLPGEGYALYRACKAMCNVMNIIGIAIDGGKDSLSMAARMPPTDGGNSDVVKAPGALVISAYAPCPDITKIITPDLKAPSRGMKSALFMLKPAYDKNRLGGTAFAQVFEYLSMDSVPDCDENEVHNLITIFNIIQKIIRDDDGLILAMHDISDGGLATTLLEMAIAGWCGISITIPKLLGDMKYSDLHPAINFLFNEEAGWVVEIAENKVDEFIKIFQEADVANLIFPLGSTTNQDGDSKIEIVYETKSVFSMKVQEVAQIWEETSFQLERLQMNPELAQKEYDGLETRKVMDYSISFSWNDYTFDTIPRSRGDLIVAIIREEGCNGDREMAAAFMYAGFGVHDMTMTDFLTFRSIHRFIGIVFPGGFSYADVLGSGVGWACAISENEYIIQVLRWWHQRKDTFSLGICNGCQLMARLDINENKTAGPDFKLTPNDSGRFESRWSRVKIQKSNSIFLTGMEESTLGVWVAHGEGKFAFRNEQVKSKLMNQSRVALTYIDEDGNSTEEYPFNPNGSEGGIAGISSEDGRHLALMPHPERSFLSWQWPYKGTNASWNSNTSPWSKFFQNAYEWCKIIK